MRLTKNDGSRKVAIYRAYETIEESEEKYQEKHNECEIYNKLTDLEDIEDEFGVELITLVKAIKNGIWCKCCLFDDAKISYRKPDFISLKNKCLVQECDDGSLHSSTYFIYYYSKDYGKTWALTEEELL